MGELGGTSPDADLVSAIRGVLEQFRVADASAIAEAVALHRDGPRWALWLPLNGQGWAAMRPASSRPPDASIPMLWVRAGTAAELGAQMRRADAALSPELAPVVVARWLAPLPPRDFR